MNIIKAPLATIVSQVIGVIIPEPQAVPQLSKPTNLQIEAEVNNYASSNRSTIRKKRRSRL